MITIYRVKDRINHKTFCTTSLETALEYRTNVFEDNEYTYDEILAQVSIKTTPLYGAAEEIK